MEIFHPTDETSYPHVSDRLGPAWRKLCELLADGDWHYFDDLWPAICAAGPVEQKTAFGLLHSGKRSGFLERARLDKDRYIVRLDPRYGQTPSDDV